MPATNEVLQDGRYKINHQFPTNGDGVVFDAYDTVRNTKVLVKEIVVRMNRVTTASQQDQLKVAFANQAKILSSIKHDTLINIHDFFSEIGRQYLVMEALEGNELSDLISREGKGFAVESVVRWADQLLDGLHYLHTFEPSIIHKNIRPDNIKLTPDNRVKLLAFGLADGSDTRISTSVPGDRDESEISYSPLEQVWESLDSASQRVIADSYGEQEERMLRLPLDASSDIYSLGATLYHLLTGSKPISALERAIEVLDGNEDPLPVPSAVNTKISESVSKLVMTAMRVKRSDRFSSAAQMRDTLRSVFPLNDLDKSEQPTEINASKGEVFPTAALNEQEAQEESKANLKTKPDVMPAVAQPPVAAPIEEFSSVLTVDHDGGDGTARYEVETPAAVIPTSFTAEVEEDELEPFTYGSTKKGSSSSMFAIAGGLALLLVVGVGGWFAFSAGSSPRVSAPQTQTQMSVAPSEPATAAPQTETAEQPAAVPVQEVSAESSQQPESASTDQTEPTRNSAKPTAGRSPKPAAKEPAKKKALTVDDLIRDN